MIQFDDGTSFKWWIVQPLTIDDLDCKGRLSCQMIFYDIFIFQR